MMNTYTSSMMAVAVDATQQSFQWTSARVLFQGSYSRFPGPSGPRNYDLSPYGHRLQPDEPRIDLIIVGGAAMVLLFDARDSTKDVDSFQLDPDAASRVAEAAAARYAFDDLWESEHGTA